MRRIEVPILIVGGGPIGLSLGLLFGRFAIPAIVLERNPTTTNHPKARGCFARAMELFRIWGVEKSIRSRGLPAGSDHWVIARSLAELHPTRSEVNPHQGPAWKCNVAQDVVEEELLKVVRNYPTTEVRFRAECVAFEQDPHGVIARVVDVDNGDQSEIRCQYLVGSDGAGSRIRKIAGIKMTGIPSIAYMANDYFRVDLSDNAVARGCSGLILAPLKSGDAWISLLNTDGRDRWLALRAIGAEKDDRARVPTDEEACADLQRRLGVDRKVEVINRTTWRAAREVAETYRAGRVFLAGDAAHRFLPNGGQGMNTGIADAHNLAWKLAFTVKGAMDSGVLETYDTERRPAGNNVADYQLRTSKRMRNVQARINLDDEDSIDFWTDELSKHMKSVGQTLGPWYPEGVLVSDETTPPAFDQERYTPVDRPGHRFPHVWLDEAQTMSTIDWFDTRFVLVTGSAATEWRSAGVIVAGEILAPLDMKTIEAPDRRHGLMISKRGAVLVRPDGYVAWRSASRSDTALEDLREVLGILGVRSRPHSPGSAKRDGLEVQHE